MGTYHRRDKCTLLIGVIVGVLSLLLCAAQPLAAQMGSLHAEQVDGTRSNRAGQYLGDPSPCGSELVPTRECFRYANATARRPATLPMRAPDHRYEGLAVGFALGAVAGGLLGAVACGQSDNAQESCAGDVVKGGLILGGLGGLAGLLVGGAIAKTPKTPPEAATQ